jgi:predicted extracellular nuclease
MIRPALLVFAALTASACGAFFAHPDGGAGSDGGSYADGGSDGGALATNFIPQIRNPATGTRATEGAPIHLENVVVTGVKTTGPNHGFFVQDPNVGAWAGIYVFVGSAAVTVSPGAEVSLTGTFHIFRELDEIDVTQGSVTQTGSHAVPPAVDVAISDINDTGARKDELQSMLVRIKDVQVSAITGGTDFTVVDTPTQTMSMIVSSYIANDVGANPFSPTVGTHYSSIIGYGYVTGPTSGPFSHKLAPRSPVDLVQ